MIQSMMRSSLGLVIVFIVSVAVIFASSKWLSGARFDLTEQGLYTLSDGTKNILENIENPIELTLYFSNKGTSELPALRTYANRVKELLEEYSSLSNGKITLTVVDPVPFSEAEDEAAAAGLQGIPVGARSDEIYFGLVGKAISEAPENKAENEETAPSEKEEVIPFFQLDKESFLEHDLTKLVYNLSQDKSPVLGIISSLDLNGGFDYMSRQRTPAWIVVQQMEELFELRWMGDDVEALDEDIDMLLVVHPKSLADQTMLAIDQFVLGGGNTMIFVDPLAESESSAPMMPAGDKSSNLPKLFDKWGVEFVADKIVGDYANSLVVSMGAGQNPVRHIGLIGLGIDAMNADDVVVAGLESVNLASAGHFKTIEGASTQIEPLLLSSPETMPVSVESYSTMQSPDLLLKDFVPEGKVLTLAARIAGAADTAFPEGVTIEEEVKTENSADSEVTSDETEGVKTPETIKRHIAPTKLSTESINVIVVADTDILTDRLWVQVQDFFGQRIASPWADNAGFLINSLDNLSGNADLISVRSRGRFSRPFDLVDDIRRQAEEKFLEQQEILQQQLNEAETRLAELEQQRQSDDQRLFTPEQEKALDSFQQDKLKIRKELRDVQHQLDQDIETLGSQIKLINIFLVPVILTLLVIFMKLFVSRKRVVS